jgi:hypothetical protein
MADDGRSGVPETPLAFLDADGELGDRMRTFDWSRSPLGSPPTWPRELQTLVGVMLGSAQPMFIAWGPDRVMLYNQAYAEILGDRHPKALGRPFKQVWFDILDDVQPILDRAYAGQSTHIDSLMLIMLRDGYPAETHFSFSYSPVRDVGGAVVGAFCACAEISAQVAAVRAQAFLTDLADKLRELESDADIMAAAAESLGRHLEVSCVGYAEADPSGVYLDVQRHWRAPGFPASRGATRGRTPGAPRTTRMKEGPSESPMSSPTLGSLASATARSPPVRCWTCLSSRGGNWQQASSC